MTDQGIRVGPHNIARQSSLGAFLKVFSEPFVRHRLRDRTVPLCAFARESLARKPVKLVTDRLLDGTAAIRALSLGNQAVDALQELVVDGDGDVCGRHGRCSGV